MKTILKLVIAAALLNAAVRGANAAWNYYQLRDSAQQTLLFGSQWTAEQIHQEIIKTAMELDLPLEPENLAVRLVGRRRMAEGSYTQMIELFPSYRYPVDFSFVEETVVVGTPPGDDEYPPRPWR
jgi:hypothetical protein